MAFGPVSIGGSSYVLPPATADTLGGVVIGDNLTVDEQGKVNLSIATATTLGGVKVGSGLTVDADGTLSVGSALAAYPVGSIYQSTDPTSPAALFGGSWEEIASERVLMGASSTHAAGSTVKAGLPNLNGSFSGIASGQYPNLSNSGALSISRNSSMAGYEGGSYGAITAVSFDASKSNAIYGRSSTVQPAAYYVHIWHRVA